MSAPSPRPLSATLRQWCARCMKATLSEPCPSCWDGQSVTCAECGWHAGHIEDDDDE